MMAVKEITGKHVLIGFVLAFGLIIGVNILLAVSAVKTFPGLEVKNSYIASQTFDERKAAQEALGWTIGAHHHDGILILSITDEAGEPVRVAKLDATVGRATNVAQDVTPDFRFDGNAYVAREDLNPGNWDLWLEITALDGTEFTQRLQVEVLH